MRKLPKLALIGIAAMAVGSAAAAADPDRHVMDVPLPDGSTAHIEYVGDVAPKVTIVPPAMMGFGQMWMPRLFPNIMNIDRIIERMNRQRDAILRRMQPVPRQRVGPGATAHIASTGSLPAAANSIRVVSINTGSGTCTRTTQVTSRGEGKAPKVLTKVSGNCTGAGLAPAIELPAPDQSAPINHS